MANLEIIKNRWQSANKIKGLQNVITLPDGAQISGVYYLTESGSVTASHNALDGFSLSVGFPTDMNGCTVNDRDYQRDTDAQEITRLIAAKYDSRAIQTPVIISRDGVVLSGNGRTMAGELAARDNTDNAYLDYLKQFGASFGFTADMVTTFAHPRLVFEISDEMPYNAQTFARFNAQEMKSQSKTETAVKYGKLVNDETFCRIISTINAFETLGDFYACTEAATNCLNDLRACGVIDSMSYAQLFDGDTISATGRELLENVLIGKAFASDPDCARMITTYKSLRKSVVSGLSEVVNNLCLSGDYTLNNELLEAVNLAYIARQHGYKSGERVSEYSRQVDAFSNNTVCDYKDISILILADALNAEQVTLLKRILAVYNHQAKDASDGQTDMFAADGVKTKTEILEEVKAIFAKGSTKETKEAVKEATEARLNANMFISEEMATKVVKGGYVEYICKSGDVIICQVDAIKRGIAYLSGKGGIKLWCNVSEVRATVDHSLSLPEWLRTGEIITDNKSVSQRIAAITDNFVIFEWINGGLFDVNITTILEQFVPSKDGKVELIENV
jgi:hypothetical protein